ncbi:MAG: hypothetical protein HKN24_06475 [Acidimicrobiales bacterium]|nr:hypothetical protein [Acidimicrobiales bacterium]
MSQARAEFIVEPFTEGAPGPHVDAAIAAARAAGFEPDVGPFGTAITGAAADVFAALNTLVESSTRAGATRISVQVTVE